MSGARSPFRLPWRSAARIRAELDEELRFHREMVVAEHLAAGRDRAEAERLADAELAGAHGARASIEREDRRFELGERVRRLAGEAWQDLTLAVRGMRAAPGVALLVSLTIALGVGANVAVFGAVRGVLLQQLPYGDADRVLNLYEASPADGHERGHVSAPSWLAYREAPSLAGVAAWMQRGTTLATPEGPMPLDGALVSADLFDVLRVRMLHGRGFAQGEDSSGAPRVAVLAHAAWRTHFGADPGVVGRTVLLGERPTTVVGVLPPGFTLPGHTHEVYVPLAVDRMMAEPEVARKQRFLRLLARLEDGATPERAAAEVRAISQRLATAWPAANAGYTAGVEPVRETMHGAVRLPLLVLLGASALVLLIAGANVAGVLVARTMTRRQELAVRAALGAGRGRLVRQLLVESMALAVLGGTAGLLVAYAGTAGLRRLAADMLPPGTTVAVDGATLGFAALVVLGGGALLGLAPAITGAGLGLRGALAAGRAATPDRARQRLRAALVMLQTALAVVLLVGAGLLTRSLVALSQVELGYETERVLVFRVSPPFSRYPDADAQARFWDALHARLRALPGVVAVGHTGVAPLNGGPTSSLGIVGRPWNGPKLPEVNYASVSDDYFAALGVRLVQGRVFTPDDDADAPRVAIVNEALARRYFPAGDALGARIRLGPRQEGPGMEIVGIVANTHERGADGEAGPMAYEAMRQNPWGSAEVLVRTSGDPLALVPAARRIVRELDDRIPLVAVRTMADELSRTFAPRRTPMVLLVSFAALALVLAAVGLYGVTAYMVAARTRELGVRMALGAERGRVLRLVLRHGLATALPGLAAGLLGAAALSRLLESLLYGIQPLDVATFLAVPVMLLVVILLALAVPARRATRVDPVVALRE